MKNYALINSNGIVENMIVCEDDYDAPDGYSLVQSDAANIGDSYKKGKFISQTNQE